MQKKFQKQYINTNWLDPAWKLNLDYTLRSNNSIFFLFKLFSSFQKNN